MNVIDYKLLEECAPGAQNMLTQCLGAQTGERILALYTPRNNYKETLDYELQAGERLFWLRQDTCFPEGELDEEMDIVYRDRETVLYSLQKVAEEIGCSFTLFPIELTRGLSGQHSLAKDSISRLRVLSRECDILLDYTLIGIDNYNTRTGIGGRTFLKDEIIHARNRGADIHSMDIESLAMGAMYEDYLRMAERVKEKAEMLRQAESIHITASGTDIELPIQKGTELVEGIGIIRRGEWHFLPNGILSICVNHRRVQGHIKLAGPMWGVSGLDLEAVTLKANSHNGILEPIGLFRNRQLKELIATKEGKYIGEVTLGFNTKGLRGSESPYEFYVASGNVTVALGVNRHLGGSNPEKPGMGLTPNIHSHALVDKASVWVHADQRDIGVLRDGGWLINHEVE